MARLAKQDLLPQQLPHEVAINQSRLRPAAPQYVALHAKLAANPRGTNTLRSSSGETTKLPCRNRPNNVSAYRILVCGLSRSGSTWQYNALRTILRIESGMSVTSAHSDAYADQFEACLSQPPCVLKTHTFAPRLLSAVDFVFTSHRDLRDVLLSSMQMFGSCLGTSSILRSRRGSARSHDVAQRFQQYAHWKPFACYDMSYEQMYADRTAEVLRLAKALGFDRDETYAKRVVDDVENAASTAFSSAHRCSGRTCWDSDSGFSAHHVHESTSEPGAYRSSAVLVRVALQLPACSLGLSFEHIEAGWGQWQRDHGYRGDTNVSHRSLSYAKPTNTFVDSLPERDALTPHQTPSGATRVWPHFAHVHVGREAAALMRSFREAADQVRQTELFEVFVVDGGGCTALPMSLADALACAEQFSPDYVLVTSDAAGEPTAKVYERIRAILADERLPYSKVFSLPSAHNETASNRTATPSFTSAHDALIVPYQWKSHQPFSHVRVGANGWGVAVLTHVQESLGVALVVADAPFFYSPRPTMTTSTRQRLVDMQQLLQFSDRRDESPFGRCCCHAPVYSARPTHWSRGHATSYEWLRGVPLVAASHRDVALTRCGGLLQSTLLAQGRLRSIVDSWCEDVALELGYKSHAAKPPPANRGLLAGACRRESLFTAPATKGTGNDFIEESVAAPLPLRILFLRERALRASGLVGADVRTLQMVEWLCELGHSVTILFRDGAPALSPTPQCISFMKRDANDLRGLSERLDAVDVLVLEASFSAKARVLGKPIAVSALESFHAKGKRHNLRVVVVSYDLHYHAWMNNGNSTVRTAAAVYGYEREIYASDFVDAVVAASREDQRAFRDLQRLSSSRPKRVPTVLVAPVLAKIDLTELVDGSDVQAHLNSFAARTSAVFIAESAVSLERLLVKLWPSTRSCGDVKIRLVVIGPEATVAVDDADAALLDALSTAAARGFSVSRCAARTEVAAALKMARVVVMVPPVATSTTVPALAISCGVPVVAPRNTTLGGLVDPDSGRVLAAASRASPFAFYSDDGDNFSEVFDLLACSQDTWSARAQAALELAILLSSSSAWLAEGPLGREVHHHEFAVKYASEPRAKLHSKLNSEIKHATLSASLFHAIASRVHLDAFLDSTDSPQQKL